jgi:tetratricopeptide (TPR) repeat protein
VTFEPTNIASRYFQRRVLLLSLIPLALLFVLTVTLAGTYHAREEALVRDWSRKGSEDLSAGHPTRAFEDFRNALSYDPDNDPVQLLLAEALLADGRLPEARSYLVNLWDRSPGSGKVNYDLAHVSMRMGDWEQAVRYFQTAIYGSWDDDPAQQRIKVRLELFELLLGRGQTSQAQAELASLAADIPPEDATLHEQIGRLFLRAGQPSKALAEFDVALRSDPRQSRWLEEAGNAAFAAGDYAKAETYLARAARENPSDEDHELLRTVREVLDDDPLRAGLSNEERAQRSWRAFQQGLARLQECTGSDTASPSSEQTSSDLTPLVQDAKDIKSRVNLQSLRKDPDLRNEAMQLVFHIEETTSKSCGTPTGVDEALALIGKQHAGNNP